MDEGVPITEDSGTALQRMRLVSQALSDAARRTRVSSRSRRAYSSGGFQARRGAVALRWAMVIGFYVLVVLPTAAATVYYGFIASNQYVAQAMFTVSGGEPIPMDGLSSIGIPMMAIVQDTQVVVNYLHSRAAVDHLQQAIDIRAMFSGPGIDPLSRFNPDKPIEKFVRYWDWMTSTTIRMPSGTVDLKVRAFTAADSVTIANAALVACEQLINQMNDRMRNDAVANAEEELRRANDRLSQTQIALEQARNDRGMLDAVKSADAINKLINDTRAALLKLQEQYNTQLKFVSDTAPQLRELKARIDATVAQLNELQGELTSTTAGNNATLASAMTRFSELELEHTVAQRLFMGATAVLEAARLLSERKMMYLNTFVRPALPERPEYPERGLNIALVAAGGLVIWGLCCGGVVTVRNHMA